MTAAGVVTVLLFSFSVAGPAWGKGPESVTITGPGLDRPIEIQLSGPGSQQDDTPPYLAVALTELADPYYAGSEVELSAGPPPRPLRDRYTLTWHMSRPPDADPADYTVVQDLYPDAFTMPVIHTRPGRYLGDSGGWYDAPSALRDTLGALGVPVSGLPTGLPDPPRAAARTPEPSAAAVWWSLPVAATVGLAVGVGLGVTLTKLRTRERPLSSVHAAASA